MDALFLSSISPSPLDFRCCKDVKIEHILLLAQKYITNQEGKVNDFKEEIFNNLHKPFLKNGYLYTYTVKVVFQKVR